MSRIPGGIELIVVASKRHQVLKWNLMQTSKLRFLF